MGFFEKIGRGISKIKGKLIVALILFIVLDIWLIATVSAAIYKAAPDPANVNPFLLNWDILLDKEYRDGVFCNCGICIKNKNSYCETKSMIYLIKYKGRKII